ncbi:hypothetical protein D3C72_421210 [compost metagenome]
MAWIEFHQTLRGHPKTARLRRLLNIRLREAVGMLGLLWLWSLEHAPKGVLTRYDPYDLAEACDWDGDPDELVSALVRAGFLDREGDELVVHDWFVYAGRLIERREANAERMRLARKGRADHPSEHAPAAHASRTMPSRATNVQRTCDARAPMNHDHDPNHDHDLNLKDRLPDPDDEGELAPAGALAPALGGKAAIEPEKSSPRRTKGSSKGPESFSPLVVELVEFHAAKVEGYTGDRPKVNGDWYVELDRLLRIDKRDAEDVRATLEYAFRTSFWPPNVLKPSKLRKHWETLRAQAARDARKPEAAPIKPRNVSDEAIFGFLSHFSGGEM